SLHVEHAAVALAAGRRVLVEKPLGLAGDDLSPLLAPAVADRVAVAFNLRFHRPLVRLAEVAASAAVGRISSVALWFGSWLPDWRPGTDYRAGYSARAALGGGVLHDAIHELDVLLWLVGDGDYRVRGAVVDRLGPLEIDVEDTVAAVLQGPGGVCATIRLDYLSRRYRRGVEVIGEHGAVRLDWARSVLEVEDADGVRTEPAGDPVDRSYERQASAFLEWVAGGPALPVGAALGARSVALVAAIRAAAA
nr:Gfo/Idh/MocA family oxidoreductase [Acidimicrobiia bacterium]